MAAAVMKHMASSFAKLENFKGVDFRRWQKKMHFMLSSMSLVYVLTTPMPNDGGENPTVEQVRKRAKWDNDDYDTLEAKYMAEDASSKKFLVSNFTNYKMTDSRPVLEQYNELLGILGRFTQHNMNMDESIKVSCIIDKLPPSWKDFKHTLKHLKEELTLIELGSHLRIEESLRAQDNDKPKGNNVAGPSVVNMVEYNNSSRYNDNKGKRKHHDTRANPNKKPKVTCWKCGKPGHLKKDCKAGNVGNKANGSGMKGSEDGSSNPLKGQNRCWFKTYESLNDGSILHMGNESTALVHGCGCVDLRLNIVSDNIDSAFMSTSKLNDSILWHARLGHVHFKRMQDMSKDGLIPAFDMDTEKCQTCMLNKITKKPFKNVKRETEVLELIHNDLCDLYATPSLGNKKYLMTFIDDASRFCYVYLLHSKDEALDKFKVFKTEVELQQGSLIKRFRTDRGGEYMDTLYFQSVGIIYETTAPYTPQQNGLSQGFWGEAMAVVRLPDPKLKTLGKRGIECILVGYAEHSKAFRPSQRSLVKGTKDSGGSVVSERVTDEIVQQSEPKLRKSKRHMTLKDFGPEFQIYLIEGAMDEDVAFWKEAIIDETYSIMGNNTWVLTDLPPGCRPLGCKWIFKRKLKVDRTIEKFKARLVIQGFKQKSGIDYFDTYTLVARISTIRLLIAMASIHSLIIHQMDVKTAFLNGELEEEIYMNQPLGFILPGNENNVCKLVDLTKEFLSSRFSMKDMGEADVILGIRIKHESNGIAISQSHYIEKVLKKFDYSDCTPVSTPLDTCEKLMPNRGLRVLKYLKKTMDYRLMYSGYPLVLEGYTDASWISNTEDNSSTSGWVFLLGGGTISWASKKQTCITGSTMESKFVALTAAGKEAECDATLTKAYSQMYNGKSRHLGVRHSMIRELITNGVVFTEFVRSQQNLADHLTKGLDTHLPAEETWQLSSMWKAEHSEG
ncbi:zinc finger, CCHC-type containing protein [Tanacetum coccineum]